MLGLSKKQWPVFLRVSLEVCKDYSHTNLSDLDPMEKERIVRRIKDSAQKHKLPALDDEGIKWRVSKVLPELRHMQRLADHFEEWKRMAGTRSPNRVLGDVFREAVNAKLQKIPERGKDLRYWTQIPEEVRLEFAKEANKRLLKRGLPTMDIETLLHRLRKRMNHWLKDENHFMHSHTNSHQGHNHD
ncbi:hypothetical protein ACET3X_001800 [Alternaria dauci]|uniref:Uncharacterized protein n=1 Tax=Alternaria dauci TaxID=48095 RepID=A0ABR3UYE4_9PLEO